jgi:large subunit ribosomal protein L13e
MELKVRRTMNYPRNISWCKDNSFFGLQEAGVPRKLAPTIGIPVDSRRQNLSTESLSANVERLKAYKARLILFPRKSGQHKKLDSTKDDLKAVKDAVRNVGAVLPIESGVGVKHGVKEVKTSEMPESTEGGAYRTLREARSEARLVGVREKRARLKAEEAEAKKGK